jgi:hypothetical protein
MSTILPPEQVTVTRERRTRCITIDTPEGGFRVSLQRQQLVRDATGAVLGRGELETISFGAERLNTPKLLALVQAIADACDEIDAAVLAERAANAETVRISELTTKDSP